MSTVHTFVEYQKLPDRKRPHGHPYNIANSITSDLNPNTTSLVIFMFN